MATLANHPAQCSCLESQWKAHAPGSADAMKCVVMVWRCWLRPQVWKYGERGWRYSQLDLGHAAEAVAVAARLAGWTVKWLNAGATALPASSTTCLLG